MFSLTVLFGFASLAALIGFMMVILRQLGAGDAANSLAAASIFCIALSVVFLYVF